MRRPFVTSTFALALALAPALSVAQTPPPTQQPPAQPPAQTAPAAPAQPPQGVFTAPAGMFLNTIKTDQTAAFEETMAKVKEAIAKSTNESVKKAGAGWKVYKALEPAGQGVLYVFTMDPTVADFDYSALGIFKILQDGLGDATAREIFEKFRNAFGAPQNKLNLTPLGSLGGGI
jgi:hypothetical protein